jgi:hypothetical protein
LYITWSDREGVIRSGGIDILDNLPHFLLVLLIIQRFDLGRWGIFTEFEGSPIHPKRDSKIKTILEATFDGGDTVHIFPFDDLVHGGINVSGRSTNIAGARRVTGQDTDTTTSEKIKEGNDLVVKFSWPNKSRESEAKFIEMAKKFGEKNGLIKDHIPTMLGHMDPPYLTCSTRRVRDFLGLEVDGERVLRIMLFRRLEEIKFLDEEHMVIAFLDCFFCEFLS